MNKLKEEKFLIENRIRELQIQNYDWLDAEKVTTYILKFKENLLSNDNALKRKVVETFVDKIKIYPERIDLNFKICMTTNPKVERDMYGGEEPYRIKCTISIVDYRHN